MDPFLPFALKEGTSSVKAVLARTTLADKDGKQFLRANWLFAQPSLKQFHLYTRQIAEELSNSPDLEVIRSAEGHVDAVRLRPVREATPYESHSGTLESLSLFMTNFLTTRYPAFGHCYPIQDEGTSEHKVYFEISWVFSWSLCFEYFPHLSLESFTQFLSQTPDFKVAEGRYVHLAQRLSVVPTEEQVFREIVGVVEKFPPEGKSVKTTWKLLSPAARIRFVSAQGLQHFVQWYADYFLCKSGHIQLAPEMRLPPLAVVNTIGNPTKQQLLRMALSRKRPAPMTSSSAEKRLKVASEIPAQSPVKIPSEIPAQSPRKEEEAIVFVGVLNEEMHSPLGEGERYQLNPSQLFQTSE